MSKLTWVLAFGLAAILPAEACDCGRAESAAVQASGATVIFVGKAQKTVPSGEEGSDTVSTTFTLMEALKGEPGDPVVISHPAIVEMNCGVDFKEGEDALVFAYAETPDAPLVTNACAMPQFSEEEVRAALKTEPQTAPKAEPEAAPKAAP